jgi:hypothetical protein
MMKKVSAALLLTLVLALTIGSVVTASAPSGASGSGKISTNADRIFSFTAVQSGPDYAAKGQGQLVRTDEQLRFHFAVDCLRVEGNTAYVSGKITNSNVWGADWPVWFKVVDNGEGSNAIPDQMTLLAGWDPGNLDPEYPIVTCAGDPGWPDLDLIDVASGNIQVR